MRWATSGTGCSRTSEHIQEKQTELGYHFEIVELGGPIGQNERILNMQPIVEEHRFWLPPTLTKTQYDGSEIDVIKHFVEDEFEMFPKGVHPDLFDAISRIRDEDLGRDVPLPGEEAGKYVGTSGARRH